MGTVIAKDILVYNDTQTPEDKAINAADEISIRDLKRWRESERYPVEL